MFRCTLVLFATLMAGPPVLAQSADPAAIQNLRKQLKQEEALKLLKTQEGEKADPALLSTLALEAALLDKLGPYEKRRHLNPKAAVEKLAALDLSDREELTLAGLCYLLDLIVPAEEALGRARDKNPELKNRTDEILAERRGEAVPRGGYFRYLGRYLSMEERDRHRALDQSLASLYPLEIDGLLWRFIPSPDGNNHDRFMTMYGEEGPKFLRQAASLLRKELGAIYKEIRSWIPSYDGATYRQKIQESLAGLDPLRNEALQLIARYDKPEQPQVDEYRAKLEALYLEHERLLNQNLGRIRNLRPERGYALWKRVKDCEEALDHLDQYFRAAGLQALESAEVRPARDADATPRHLLPGRGQSGLEDVLWLVLNYTAGRTIDVLQRVDELLRQEKTLTPWEKWLIHQMRIEALERYNQEVVTSLDPEERAFIDILTRYRKVMGLEPFEVEERCVVAARKHSQEMVDLSYFGHISPVRRNRTPSDRVRLEGFSGGVGENCLAGGGPVDARGAFEGWYHSPGHHRLLVSRSPQVGVGAAAEHRMWTMVAGGLDLTWRQLHRDLPPAERAALDALVSRYSETAKTAKREKPPEDLRTQLEAALPSVLAILAREAFGAVHARSAERQARAPVLLEFLIHAEVPEAWRPLQVAAVSAAIDLMDTAANKEVRAAAFALVRTLVPEDQGYDPEVARSKRRVAVLEIRKAWEDEAQWRYRMSPAAEAREPERPPGRVGDGPALTSPLKVLNKKERYRLAKLHGGGAHTERAVEMGLEWLAKVQSEDGGWRSRSFSTRLPGRLEPGELGMGRAEWEIAMTGLALLAFVYAGNTTHQGEYAETVDRGARFLMSHIVDYGMFETTSSHYMYGHAMATQALSELYAYTADPYIGIGAQLCVDYLIYAQHPESGGWRYRAKERGDTSVTGWVILALHSARKAELDVAGLRDALRFLDRVTYPCYFEVGYLSNKDGGHARLCAVGSSTRLFITGDEKDVRLLFNAKRLMRELPQPGQEDFYYWYYGTLFLFQMGGKSWKAWNEALVPALLANQVDDRGSPLHGSFTPRGPYSDQGGRIYQTSLGLLMLMTYYRYDRGIKPKLGAWTGNIQREVDPYIEKLRNSEDPVVLEITERKMLDKFGSTLAAPLIEALRNKDEKEEFRRRLASMLSRCAQPRFESFILDLLREEGDHRVRELLVHALDGISSSQSVPSLIAYLNDGSHMVRGYSASALGRIGDPEAVLPLSERLEKEKDGWCRSLIEEALQRLAHRESLLMILEDALKGRDEGRLRIQENLEIFERSGLAKLLLHTKEREPRLYERIKDALRKHREWAAVPLALIGLESEDLDTRSESLKMLRAVTRKNHGFEPSAPKEERAAALEKWLKWWEKHLEDYGA